jgi:hypothetical protein
MDNPSKRSRHNRPVRKNHRKQRSAAVCPLSPSKSSIALLRNRSSPSTHSSAHGNSRQLNDIIDDLTSEADDLSHTIAHTDSIQQDNVHVEPDSPPMNRNHRSFTELLTGDSSIHSKKSPDARKKFNRHRDRTFVSPSDRRVHDDANSDVTYHYQSLGDTRRDKLTKCMEYYRNCLESAQQFHTMGTNDSSSNAESCKQYTTTLW